VMLTASGPGGASRTAPLQVLPASVPPPPGNVLVNGSFEQSPVIGSAGWRLTRGSVDQIGASAWQQAPNCGSLSLDLVGRGPQPSAGSIEQSFPTVPGQDYLFSGWIAHHPGNPVAPEGRANVSLNGQFFVQLFHRDTQATLADMRWMRFAYRFRATAATTTL